MLKFLKDLLQKRNDEIKALNEACDKSTDINEVRSIKTQLEAKLEEVRSLQAQIKELEKEPPVLADDKRGANSTPTPGFNPLASYGLRNGAPADANTDPFDTVEYRTAFMNYACRGTAIPMELRASAVTLTTDASAVIPTTIMNEIIKELKSRGGIWAKVRKLNVQGGVEFPILSLTPTATWVGENTAVDSQKLKADTKVSFKYFGLECKLAQSLLASITTLAMFQDQFVPLCVAAVITAIEIGVFNGSGTGQMTGILKDSRVPATQVIEMSEADMSSWKAWKSKVFAKIKLSYGAGEFYMAKGTFDANIDGMVDANGQPIARTNYGIVGAPAQSFGGKVVELVEDDIIAPYETAPAGDTVAVFVNLNNYGVNSNLEMKLDKWEDKDTHEIKNNCLMILDGKLIDVNGVLIIKKKATA